MIEIKRYIFNIVMIVAVGLLTGLFLGGKLLPSKASGQQYNETLTDITRLNVMVHSHDGLALHEHELLTSLAVTESSPHGSTHNLASTMLTEVSSPSTGPKTLTRGDNEVWAGHRQFMPGILTVPVGTTVTWINIDHQEHYVTFDNGEYDARIGAKGTTCSYTFNQAGTYDYFCAPHYEMRAKIIVR